MKKENIPCEGYDCRHDAKVTIGNYAKRIRFGKEEEYTLNLCERCYETWKEDKNSYKAHITALYGGWGGFEKDSAFQFAAHR